MTEEDWEKFKNATKCHICNKSIWEKDRYFGQCRKKIFMEHKENVTNLQ